MNTTLKPLPRCRLKLSPEAWSKTRPLHRPANDDAANDNPRRETLLNSSQKYFIYISQTCSLLRLIARDGACNHEITTSTMSSPTEAVDSVPTRSWPFHQLNNQHSSYDNQQRHEPPTISTSRIRTLSRRFQTFQSEFKFSTRGPESLSAVCLPH